MSVDWSPGALVAMGASCVVLFAFDLALSVLLLGVTGLSRVALRRITAESGGRLDFLVDIKTIASTHRAAVHAVRQACLLGGIVALALTAGGAGFPQGWKAGALAGGALGVFLGVVVLETFLARLLVSLNPRSSVRVTAMLVRPAYAAAYPIVRPMYGAFARWSKAISDDAEREDEGAEDDVEAFIEVGEREGILEADEGDMVRGIMDIGDTCVREIMTARTDVVAIPSVMTVVRARAIALEAGYSRYPVYGDNLDSVVGVLHVRDLLRAWAEGWEEAPASAFMRPALFVPETRTVSELLREMRQRTHVALIVDEYGGLAGLVTLEDLIEEIVGDIRDEHDADEVEIQPQPDGSVVASGLTHVEEIEDLFGVQLDERDYDTVGGLATSAFGRVPGNGESIVTNGLRIDVLEADPRRVYRVRLTREGGGVPPATQG